MLSSSLALARRLERAEGSACAAADSKPRSCESACAFDHGCDLAMMVAEAGGESQRNAERQGFRVACTRPKWRLFPPARY
jgi:hypothetical protein